MTKKMKGSRERSDEASKTSFTPGPWHVSPMAKDIVYAKTDGKRDELCVTAYKRANGESEANARLIAAAPELLEALKWLMPVFKHPEWTQEEKQMRIDGALQAIAKAEGK